MLERNARSSILAESFRICSHGRMATLAFARKQFNEAVLEYNSAVRQFPTVLIVGLFGFRGAGTL